MNKTKTTYLKLILSCILCLISCISIAQTKSKEIKTVNGKKYYIHKVEKGQSLYAISKTYGMDINSILAENDEAIDGLKTGQELKIPCESLVVPKSNQPIDTTKYVYHKIQKGETVYALTKKYTIDEQKLKALNPSIDKGLKEGDYIIVAEKKAKVTVTPPIKKQVKDTSYYTVAQGETLYSIATKFEVSQSDILKWNSSSKEGIKQGQILKLLSDKAKQAIAGSSVANPVIIPTKNVAPYNDSIVINKPKKAIYNVGLFLPFKLDQSETLNIDELVRSKNSFPNTQSLALDFYVGFKTAVDSLISKDFDVTIHLYDIDENDSSKIEAICKTNDFKELDIIFGPLYSAAFRIASIHTKASNIPSVSPLTQQNKILFNNPLASKVNLSQYTLIESLADYCSDSLMAASNIILVNTTAKDRAYIKSFKNKYNDNLKSHGKSIKDTLTEVKGVAGVKSAFIAGKNNVVILLTNNQVYLQDFITQLFVFSDKKDITLMGFNNVTSIDNLDQGYLNDLHFHYATANAIDYTQPLTKNLVKHYQEMYIADPSDYYFEAYDIASYYLSHLKTKGPSFFLNLDQYRWDGIATGFKFYRPDSQTGFENRAVYIYKYADYKLQKLGWK